MKNRVFLNLVVVVFSVPGFAKSNPLQKALEKYAKASSLQTEMKKTDEKIILGTKSESSGILKYQKSKIYISQVGDRKVEFFYNDKTLTLVEYPDAEFNQNGARKITTIKKAIPPLVYSLLNLFSDPKNFNKEFTSLSSKTENEFYLADLKSSQKNLKSFNLKINIKKNEIVSITFVDDVDTKTVIEFTNLKLNAKLNKNDFQFTKLKSDEEMSE